MKAKISELMDGELGREEGMTPIEALRHDGEAREAWRTYHLIGDAMRDTRMLTMGFSSRVATRISAEPTVMAPLSRPRTDMGWPALSLAAGLAALSLVIATVYVSQQVTAPAVDVARAPRPAAAVEASVAGAPTASTPAPVETAQVQPPDTAADYLLAHQGSSPRNSLQGMAPYVRMVSGRAPAKP